MSEQLTEEQKHVAFLKNELEQLKFMASRPEYVANNKNANIMVAYLNEHKLAQTEENLNEAFEAVKHCLELDVPVPPEPVQVEEPLPKWGYVLKNRKEVETFLSDPSNRAKHQKWAADYYFGEEYQRMINDAIKRSA